MPKYAYDPAKAKALLKEAGFPDGFEFDLYAYRDREYTEAVIGDLAKVGLKPKLNYMQYTAFLENVRKGKTPVAHGTWGSNSVPDVSAMTAHFFAHGPDDLTKDPEVKKLIEEADSLTDPDKRKAAWQKALARIAAEAYLGAALHLRQVLRLLQGPRLQADVRRDPAVLRGEVEMRRAPSPRRGERVG